MDKREALEGVQGQGEDEIIAYTYTVTNVGSSPSNPVVKVYEVDGEAYEDVTDTVMPVGDPSVNGDVITLPALKLLTDGIQYRVEIKYSISGNTFENFFYVNGQR